MQLSGADHQTLTDLVSDALDSEKVGMTVRFSTGFRIGDLISLDGTHPHRVFLLIEALRSRGLLPIFLKAACDAVPGRLDLRDRVDHICPAAFQMSLPSLRQTEEVIKGVVALQDDVYKAFFEAASPKLRQLGADLDLLRNYKHLHDCLHHLQIQILRRLGISSRRLLADPSYSQDLADCHIGLLSSANQVRGTIASLPDHPHSLRKWEFDWLDQLMGVADKADQALKTNNPSLGLQSAQGLRRILRHEPPRIDRYLRITAESIDLGGLADLFEQAMGVAEISPGQQDILESGRINTLLLMSRLNALVYQHTVWQQIDGCLWEFEDYMPRSLTDDAGDIAAYWELLQPRILTLVATDPSSPWSQELANECDLVQTHLKSADWGRLDAQFRNLRNKLVIRFFSVDTQLKSLAEEVGHIGDSLQQHLH